MILVFASFILAGELDFKQLGLGFAAAIFVDAFVIRTVLVPAVMHVAGRANRGQMLAEGGSGLSPEQAALVFGMMSYEADPAVVRDIVAALPPEIGLGGGDEPGSEQPGEHGSGTEREYAEREAGHQRGQAEVVRRMLA